MHIHRVLLIATEEDLLIHSIHTTILVNENDDSDMKQLLPILIVWREGRFDITNDFVLVNASSPSLTDCS